MAQTTIKLNQLRGSDGTNGQVATTDGTTVSFQDAAGGVDTSGTPVTNDFARFTDADTIEGRSYSEVRGDLSLEVGTDVQAYSADNAYTTTKLDDFATPDDNTDLNSTTTYHGLLPKLGGGTSNFLRADGTWASPSSDNNNVGVDSGATPGYLGALSSDGVLRTGSQLSYTDGGDFITLDVDEANIKLDDLGTPDDNTDLNSTISYHGLLPKLSNDSGQFLNGIGGWTTPGLSQGINVETLSANKEVVPGTDAENQYLDPNGVARAITLDTDSASTGDFFYIENTGDNTGTLYSLRVEDEVEGRIIDLYPLTFAQFMFDGSEWILNKTYKNEIAIGYGARTKDTYGMAVGCSTYSESSSVAIGYNAMSDSENSIAIGRDSRSPNDYGISIGTSSANQIGVSVGYDTEGDYYATAIGYYAKTVLSGANYAIGLGAYSYAQRYAEQWTGADTNTGANKDGRGQVTYVGSTTDATETEIFIHEQSGQRIDLVASSSITFQILVTARDNTSGDCAAYRVWGGIKRDGSNNTSLIGSVTMDVKEDDATWDVSVEADDTEESLVIKVTGDASNTVKWNATAYYTETRI